MKVKLPHLLEEIDHAPEALQKLCRLFDWVHYQVAGKDCVITCVLGDANGRVSNTHKEWRAFDARIETLGNFGEPNFYVTEKQANEIALRVNVGFPLKCGDMKAVIVHRARWTENGVERVGPLHFHCQIGRNLLKDSEAIPPAEE
jgi:hypothetical protein